MNIVLKGLISSVVAGLMLIACGGSTVTDTPGPTTPIDTTKPPTTVQRATITVKLSIDPSDAAIATSAGVSVGGLTVHLTRTTAGTTQTGTTGADGSVRFDNLLEGVYQVSVDRTLSSAETAKLAPADREVSIFAGGGSIVLSPPASKEMTISLVGSRRGSIVISEIFVYNAPRSNGLAYGLGTYIEFYNNADTTAYLDGMLFVTVIDDIFADLKPAYPCDQDPQLRRMDSTALYSRRIMAFPGAGREYPILPGEAKVLAMDAIDHRAAAPTMEQVDLSHAQFEQYYSESDTDNPESANMVRVVSGGSTGAFGRGFPMQGRNMYVLMQPAARATMTITPQMNPFSGIPWEGGVYRIPSQYVVDVLGLETAPTSLGYETRTPVCSPWASLSYEKAPAPLADFNFRKAIARKSLGRTSDGREILQRTRTSARDFEYVDPLRRSLDK